MIMERLDLPALLAKYSIRPRKSLGQNFLWDPNILDRIVQTAEIPQNAHVLEIGAGIGTLTRHLADVSERVVAVEIDKRMQPALQEVLQDTTNVEIVIGDILKMRPVDLDLPDGYQVVANIPYYITSNLIRHLLGSDRKPMRLVLTIQHEVGRRICETPGSLSLLALSVQLYGAPYLAMKIPAGAFYPAPKVDSAVLRIDMHPQPLIPPEQIDLFFTLAKAGFMQKRKKIRNSMAFGMKIGVETAENLLIKAGIDPAARAQTLDFEDWRNLTAVWEQRNRDA